MSTSLRSMKKPPLPKSPIRAHNRRIPISMRTPPGSLTKPTRPNRGDHEEIEARPEFMTISWELRAMARRARGDLYDDEIQALESGVTISEAKPVFERGRFYDEYSARRNERLRRKKGEEVVKVSRYNNLGVTVESAKRGTSKKIGTLRKSMSAAVSVERAASEIPRYSLRSMTKENKKPPLPLYADRSVTRRVKKIQY